jgi:hypothetical protein
MMTMDVVVAVFLGDGALTVGVKVGQVAVVLLILGHFFYCDVGHLDGHLVEEAHLNIWCAGGWRPVTVLVVVAGLSRGPRG